MCIIINWALKACNTSEIIILVRRVFYCTWTILLEGGIYDRGPYTFSLRDSNYLLRWNNATQRKRTYRRTDSEIVKISSVSINCNLHPFFGMISILSFPIVPSFYRNYFDLNGNKTIGNLLIVRFIRMTILMIFWGRKKWLKICRSNSLQSQKIYDQCRASTREKDTFCRILRICNSVAKGCSANEPEKNTQNSSPAASARIRAHFCTFFVCVSHIIGYLHEHSSIELEYPLVFFTMNMNATRGEWRKKASTTKYEHVHEDEYVKQQQPQQSET